MPVPFDITTEEGQDFLADCGLSTELFGKVFYEELFSRDMSKSLKKFYEVLDDDKATRVLLILPRGIGKTTNIKFGFITRRMLYQLSRYILYISETSTFAIAHGRHIKDKLVSNPMIGELWPELKTKKFAEMRWELSNGGIFLPRGDGQQVRGASDDTRPDLIVADDIESPENCYNPDLVDKRRRWWSGTVVNCLNRDSKTDRIIFVGTKPSDNSLLADLEIDEDYENVVLDLVDPSTMESQFPEFISTKDCIKSLEKAESIGMGDEWWRENSRFASNQKNKTFREAFYKYYREDESKNEVVQLMSNNKVWKREKTDSLLSMIICDPARETNPTSAESAVVCVGIQISPAAIYYRDIFSDRVEPDEMFQAAAEFCIKYNCIWAAFEVTGLGKYGSNPFSAYLRAAGVNAEIILVNAPQNKSKIQRILDIHPFYKAGIIWHNEQKCRGLEKQLQAYPTGKYVDIIDAAAYVPRVLTEVGIELDLKPPKVLGGRSLEDRMDEFDIHPEDLYGVDNSTGYYQNYGGFENALV